MRSRERERGAGGVANETERYGEWRTRARGMRSRERERGAGGVANESER